jgi:hypothetical protein
VAFSGEGVVHTCTRWRGRVLVYMLLGVVGVTEYTVPLQSNEDWRRWSIRSVDYDEGRFKVRCLTLRVVLLMLPQRTCAVIYIDIVERNVDQPVIDDR